ncbi:nuclear transport factor 2 family protein [Actinomadura barringtoniae]|uniref:Nuclear transport factor 2 family protein n=1 Tax=Actinomadura barringtoniae TaxID=1427535 RepID=A0A939PHV8_9ACTN|nr:nuclear transport factor 2 family protein [Actinomadura barringtoniae]MBO2452996.1 nuclear transport factor 2 family protein [Actinomadura barringtoniae]
MENAVDAVLDRLAIIEMVDRYMLSLDEGELDEEWAEAFHTDDVTSSTPLGDGAGLVGLAEATRVALGRYQRTQHLASGHIVDVGGDVAKVRWNALMVHVHLDSTQAARGEEPGGHFDVGGIFEGEVVRGAGGWRFRKLDVRPVWFSGQPPILEEAAS